MKEPSWTTVDAARPVAGEGDARLKLDRDSLESGRGARSAVTGTSWRIAGTGEVERLEGRKKEVGLRVYIVGRVG